MCAAHEPARQQRAAMDVAGALGFVRDRGVVLVAARGPVPRLTEAIAGMPIKGSWWGHPLGKEIYRVLNGVTDAPEVLVCRVVESKVTLVHRRLWPALIRCADRFDPATIAKVEQVHTDTGRHVNVETPFPEWADHEVQVAAGHLSESAALEALGPWATSQERRPPPRRRRTS